MKDRGSNFVSLLSFHFDAKGSSFTVTYSFIQQTFSEVGSVPGTILAPGTPAMKMARTPSCGVLLGPPCSSWSSCSELPCQLVLPGGVLHPTEETLNLLSPTNVSLVPLLSVLPALLYLQRL